MWRIERPSIESRVTGTCGHGPVDRFDAVLAVELYGERDDPFDVDSFVEFNEVESAHYRLAGTIPSSLTGLTVLT